MSKRPLIILLLFVFLLAACNNEPIEEEPITRPTPTTETAAPTQAPADDGYPADPQPTEPAAASRMNRMRDATIGGITCPRFSSPVSTVPGE
jgi:hypothetical protein